MRESMGQAWFIGLIITFTLIFTAYMLVMINYSTAFKIKNEVVHIIEKYEGLSKGDTGSIKIINNYLVNSGYNATGECQCKTANCYGAKKLNDSSDLERVNNRDKYFYCVEYTSASANTGYYDIQLFLKFDLPVFGDIGNFKIKGQTIKIKYPTTSSSKPGIN